MPDNLIYSSVLANEYSNVGQRFVRPTRNNGYLFLMDTSDGIQMLKTLNRGSSWTPTQITPNNSARPTIWYDRWTPGRSGRLIYLMYYYDGDTVWRTIDTTDDSLGSVNTLYNGVHPADTPTQTTITVSRGGQVFSAAESNSAGLLDRFWRGTTERANPWDGSDYMILVPGNETDPDDIYAPYWDRPANEISLKDHDDSGNTWGETLISGSMADAGVRSWGVTVRHSDNHVFLTALTAVGSTAANYLSWEITNPSTITARANVLTGIPGVYGAISADLIMNQQTGLLYAFYSHGPSNVLQDVYYKISSNGAVSWGSEQQYNTTQDGWWEVLAGVSIDGAGGGIAPAMFDEGADDWYNNVGNGLFFSPSPVAVNVVGSQQRALLL